MALTDKQKRFVDEYLIDLNATQAAVRAGYSEKTAYSQGQRLLKNVEVAEAIRIGQAKAAETAEVTIARVLQELSRIGFSDLRNAFTEAGALKPPREWDDDLAASIAAVEVVTRNVGKDADGNTEIEHVHKLKLWDKNSALEKIAKHLGMFVDRVEHTGRDGGPVQVEDVSARDIIAGRIAGLAARKAKE